MATAPQMGDDWTTAGKADLPAVRMPREVEGIFRCGRVIGDFRRVH